MCDALWCACDCAARGETAGQNVQSWELSKIKRDDYSPTWAGMRQWEQDRKMWQSNRLTSIVKSAGSV